MNEPFLFVKVFSAFLWILGLAIILADLSYHDFLVHKQKLKWFDVIQSRSFLWPLKMAVVFILFGLAGSVPSAFWGGVFGAAGFLAAIFFLKRDEKINRWMRHRLRRWRR